MSKKRKKAQIETALSKNQPPANSARETSKVIFLMIGLFVILLYGNTIGHQYAFDDSIVITENDYTKQGLKGIPLLLTTDMFEGMYGQQLEITGGRYRPLSLVTFAIEYEIAGLNPMIGHITNMLLYMLTGMVLFIVMAQLFGTTSVLPLLITLLFIAHPIHTEVVSNIKSRDELLCLLGLLASIHFLLKYILNSNKLFFLLSLLFFFLALLAKETAATFLVIIPVTLWFFKSVPLKKILLSGFIPFAMVFMLYFIIRTSVVGMVGGSQSLDIMENPFVHSTISDKLATISIILGKYIQLLFIPYPLSSDYSFNQIPITKWSNPLSIIWLLVYAGLTFVAIRSISKKKKPGYGILVFLLPLSLTSNILFNIGAPMGERFIYISSLGFCICIGLLLTHLFKTHNLNDIRQKKLLPGIVSIILLLFSVQTIARNADWYDNSTLFSQDVKTVPNSAKVHYYYGNVLLNKVLATGANANVQMLNEAKRSFKRSVDINPDFHWAQYNLGRCYEKLNMPDSAIYYLNKTLEIQPRHIATQGLLGKIYGMSKQDYPKAIIHLEKAIEYGDQSANNYQNLGIAYALSKNYPKALSNFEQALALDPDNARYYLDIGITYQNMNQPQKATPFLEKAYALNPSLKN